jgi:hypothetical protein
MPARDINLIVIHCSASPNGASLFQGTPGMRGFMSPVQVIDGWHKARGFHRNDAARKLFNPELAAIGYHFVIYTNGASHTGRHLDEIGAHAQGFNARSIGICMVGIGKYSAAQWAALKTIVKTLQIRYPRAQVTGHRDLSPDLDGDGVVERQEWLKTCPEFDVADWLKRGMTPAPANLLEVKA